MTIRICREINNDHTSPVPKEHATTSLRTAISEESPALCYAMLASIAVIGRPGTNHVTPLMAQWLRSKTVETLNAAIADPSSALKNSTLLAVSLIALYEATRGDPTVAAKVHQPALRQMVDARGGLRALLASNGRGMHVVRNLIWQDRIMHLRAGNALMFGDYVDESMAELRWDRTLERRSNDYWKSMLDSVAC